MNWFGFCLLSVFALAFAELIQQYVLNKENDELDERLSGFLTFILAALLMLPFVLVGYRASMLSIFQADILPFFLGASIAGAIATTFYLRSFKVESISYSSILVASSAIFSTLLGIIFLNESISLIKFFGIMLILAGIVFSNIQNEKFEKASLWGLGAGFFYGIMYIFDKKMVLEIEPVVYLFWSFLVTSLILFLKTPGFILSQISQVKLHTLKFLMLSGLGYVVYNLFTFLSYTYGGEVGKVDAINNSQIFLIILYEIFVLRQTSGIFRKLASFLLAVTGVFILGNF